MSQGSARKLDGARARTAVTRHCVSTAAASIAQLVEHALRKRMVVGSIPTGGLSCQPGPEICEQWMGRSEAPLAAQVPFSLQGPMWSWKCAAAIRKCDTPGSCSCMTRALATIFGKIFAGPIGTKIRPGTRSARHSQIRTTRRSSKPRPCGIPKRPYRGDRGTCANVTSIPFTSGRVGILPCSTN